MKQFKLELAKLVGFSSMGYWGLIHYNCWFAAILCALFGSAVIAVSYKFFCK